MSGPEKTIKIPKLVENIENCSNNISKGSRIMFSRKLDVCFLHCNQNCKARFENYFVPKCLTLDTGMTLIMDLKSKSTPEKSSKVLLLISFDRS